MGARASRERACEQTLVTSSSWICTMTRQLCCVSSSCNSTWSRARTIGVTLLSSLATSIRGKTRSVLESVKDIVNMNYGELWTKLELRFGEELLSQNLYTQFMNRKQKYGDDLVTLGLEFKGMSRSPTINVPMWSVIKLRVSSSFWLSRTVWLEGPFSWRKFLY